METPDPVGFNLLKLDTLSCCHFSEECKFHYIRLERAVRD